MRVILCAAISLIAWIGLLAGALAQDDKRDLPNAASAETSRPALTGKERLGSKWTDEQRIDNCHVPVNKRGTKPRSSLCPNAPSS
jgi:hypothetical protein